MKHSKINDDNIPISNLRTKKRPTSTNEIADKFF